MIEFSLRAGNCKGKQKILSSAVFALCAAPGQWEDRIKSISVFREGLSSALGGGAGTGYVLRFTSVGLNVQQNLVNQNDGLLVVRRGPGLAQHSTDVAGDGTIIEEVNVLKHTFNVAMEFEEVAADPAPSANLP